jgi:predicted amino acid dehydrogenase
VLFAILPPILISRVRGVKNSEDIEVRGFSVLVPILSNQINNNEKQVNKKIISFLKRCEFFNIKVAGFGGLLAGISNECLELKPFLNKIVLTTGMAMNGMLGIEGAKYLINKYFSLGQRIDIGIIAATTDLGKNIATGLAKSIKINSLILHGRSLDNLNNLKKEITDVDQNINISIVQECNSILNSNLIIVAGWVENIKIDVNNINSHPIIFDIPSNKTFKPNNRYTLIDKAYVKTPKIDYGIDFGMPQGTTFGCFAETIMLGSENLLAHDFIGKITLQEIEQIDKFATSFHFKNFGFE